MNQDLNIVSYLDKVGPQTQAKFSDEFLSSLDIVSAKKNLCVTNSKLIVVEFFFSV
jgi:hypothetical protein